MKRAARTPRGFTLVELLVVIAIIGILVGLLLPGEYKVTVTPLKVEDIPSGREGMEVPRMVPDGGEDIPQRYRNEATTPLSAIVEPRANVYDFDLTP